MDQKEPWLHVSFHQRSVDFDVNLSIRHSYLPLPARSRARRMARAVSTRIRSRLYSAEPRKSDLGSDSSEASRAACRMASSLIFFPRRASSAFFALIGVGPAFVSPIPARSQEPPAPIVNCTATAAVAKSPTFLSILMYAPPLPAGGIGISISASSSSGLSAVLRIPVKKL